MFVHELYCEPNVWNVLANVNLSSPSAMLNECKLWAISCTVASVFEPTFAVPLAAYDWRASCLETASAVRPFAFDGPLAAVKSFPQNCLPCQNACAELLPSQFSLPAFKLGWKNRDRAARRCLLFSGFDVADWPRAHFAPFACRFNFDRNLPIFDVILPHSA